MTLHRKYELMILFPSKHENLVPHSSPILVEQLPRLPFTDRFFFSSDDLQSQNVALMNRRGCVMRNRLQMS